MPQTQASNSFATVAGARSVKKINYPGSQNYSQITYDGNGHYAKIVEVSGGSTTSTRQFVWSDGSVDRDEVKELRDGTGAVLSKYFGYGQTTSGSNYFYTRDQITSVRELLASAGSIQSQYGYSPYGQVTNLQSGIQSDFQFGGYYAHLPSGLNLTVNRAYRSAIGRWISRDPSGEVEGTNLYSYVANNPVASIDATGLQLQNLMLDPHMFNMAVCIPSNASESRKSPKRLKPKRKAPGPEDLFCCEGGDQDCCDVNYDICKALCRKKFRRTPQPAKQAFLDKCYERCGKVWDQCMGVDGADPSDWRKAVDPEERFKLP